MSRIIFLHGASSSGKSTIAKALRSVSRDPWMHLSFDHLRDTTALSDAHKAHWPKVRLSVFDGLHRSFAAYADAGLDLIIEHIFDTPGWHRALQMHLAKHDVVFVGVRTPTDVLAEREAARGDREIGSAELDDQHVHVGLTYDIEVDGTAPAKDSAQAILHMWPMRTKSVFFGI